MKQFKYKSVSIDGNTFEGTMSANSKEEVVKYLQELSQYPIRINETATSRDIDIELFTKIKTKDLSTFSKQLYTLLNAGVSLINSLNILKNQTENKKLRVVISDVYDDLQKGLTLSEAMQNQNKVFPDIMINMVRSGEVTGNIDTVFDRLSTHFDKENAIKNKVKSAMVYPIFISVLATIVVTFLITFILPTFIGMFTSSGVELPGLTKALLAISDFLRRFWYIVIAAIFLIVYIVRKYINTEEGRMQYDTLKMKAPIIKGVTVKLYTTRFSRTLSTLVSSGIPLIQALEAVAKVVSNKPVEKVLLNSIEDVRRGIALSIPIRNSNLFPPMVHYMLNIGEETGAIDSMLEKTANYFDQELEESIKKTMSLIEPLLIVVMALMVGFIVIAIALPMFDMMQTVQ
jgi:type IV pilus assembly protein PilC